MSDTNNDLISIVVPVYNLENYIESCIKSIQEQTYENIEILVVDDGSSDNSTLLINKMALMDERIKPIFKGNGGVTSARLEGIKKASGEYIGFVDGDDYIEPDMYERLYENARKYHAQISHCGYQMVFPDGRRNYFYNTESIEKYDKLEALRELLSGQKIEPGLCNKMFHHSLFEALLKENIIPEDIKINEDLLMNFYLFRQAEASVFEDRCPYHYMVRYASASRQNMNPHKIYDPIKVKKLIREAASDDLKSAADRAYMVTCMNVYNGVVAEKNRALKADLKKVRELLRNEMSSDIEFSIKYRAMIKMIIYCPQVYALLYRFYVKHFQKSRYS